MLRSRTTLNKIETPAPLEELRHQGEALPINSHKLFSLGQRLARQGNEERAGKIFKTLFQTPGVRKELKGAALEELKILRGEGPLVLRVQRGLHNFMREVTRPEMLVGMGTAASFFQMGRAFGLRGLLSLGFKGRGVVFSGRAAGLASETTGFMLASHSTAAAMGKEIPTHIKHLSQEWASMAMFLGMMRSASFAVRQAYGPHWFPKNTRQKFQYIFSQQGAMYGALVGSGLTEQAFAGRDPKITGSLLRDSAALLAQFQMAGRLAHQTIGRHLLPLERALEARALPLEAQKSESGGPHFDGVYSQALAWQGAGGARPIGYRKPLETLRVHMKKKGENYGEDRPTLTDLKPREKQKTLAFIDIRTGMEGDPRQAYGAADIMRRIQDPESGFVKELMKSDMSFYIHGPFNSQKSIPRIEKLINIQTERHWAPQAEKPLEHGRRILLHLMPGTHRDQLKVEEIKLAPGGFKWIRPQGSPTQPSTPLPPSSAKVSDPARDTKMGRISELPGARGTQAIISADNFLQFSRLIRKNIKQFNDSLTQNNRSVLLESDMGFNMELAVDFLNRRISDLPKIPEGQKVIFEVLSTGEKEVAIKKGGRFVDAKQGPASRTTPLSSQRGRPSPPASEVVWQAESIPPTFNDLSQLPNLMAQVANKKYPGKIHTLILEGVSANLVILKQNSEGRVKGFTEGTEWEVLVPANILPPRSFLGKISQNGLFWQPGRPDGWLWAEQQLHFNDLIVSHPVEIYRNIVVLSRDPKRAPSAQTTFRHRGELSTGYLERLAHFVDSALNRYQVPGSTFLVTNQEGKALFGFKKAKDHWDLKLKPSGK